MRIELFEKLVFVFTVLVSLAAGGIVGVFSFFPMRSGIPDSAVESELSTLDWLEAKRAAKHGWSLPGQDIWLEPTPIPGQPAPPPGGGARPGVPGAPGGGGARPAPAPIENYANDYFNSEGGSLPPGEAIEGYPWLRRVPGVAYSRPQAVPSILYRKYQSFEDSYGLAQEGGGEFVETSAGTAYQVNWVQPDSLLASRLGLQQGDKVISVNGQPIGQGASAGQALYNQLKDETRFAVLIERQGQQQVLSFYVR